MVAEEYKYTENIEWKPLLITCEESGFYVCNRANLEYRVSFEIPNMLLK